MSMFSIQQAIEIAAQSVKMRTDLPSATYQEVLGKLERLSRQVWNKSWNKETIIEALQRFKEENGRAPIVTDLNQKNCQVEVRFKHIFTPHRLHF